MKNVTQQLLRGVQAPTAAQLIDDDADVLAALALNPHLATRVLNGGVDLAPVLADSGLANGSFILSARVRDGNGQALAEPVSVLVDRKSLVATAATGTVSVTETGVDFTRFQLTPNSEGEIQVNVRDAGAVAPFNAAVFIRLPYLALPVATVPVAA
jgi:hypothetical protein